MKTRNLAEEIRNILQAILLNYPREEKRVNKINSLLEEFEKQKPLDFVIQKVSNESDLNFQDKKERQEDSFCFAERENENRE